MTKKILIINGPNLNLLGKREESKYREKEKEVNSYIDEARTKIEKEINEKKEQVLKEAEQLADSLVERVTKGLK